MKQGNLIQGGNALLIMKKVIDWIEDNIDDLYTQINKEKVRPT